LPHDGTRPRGESGRAANTSTGIPALSLKQFAIGWLSVFGAFLVIDAVWLGSIARDFYARQIGHLMLEQPRLAVAAVFYLFYAVAIVVLAVMPALRSESVLLAAGLGATLGAAAYGTYDVTNLATLADWPVKMVVVDVLWGTGLTAVTATIGYGVVRYSA
jgi:uncharacterized membrane protein